MGNSCIGSTKIEAFGIKHDNFASETQIVKNKEVDKVVEKLQKDFNSEIVVIGGGYTGLLCAINLIENYNLDVVLVEAGKVGWGASSRNAGFCCLPPSKICLLYTSDAADE